MRLLPDATLFSFPFSEQSIDDEEKDRADSSDENPAEIERFDLPETDEATEKTANDRAGEETKGVSQQILTANEVRP